MGDRNEFINLKGESDINMTLRDKLERLVEGLEDNGYGFYVWGEEGWNDHADNKDELVGILLEEFLRYPSQEISIGQYKNDEGLFDGMWLRHLKGSIEL